MPSSTTGNLAIAGVPTAAQYRQGVRSAGTHNVLGTGTTSWGRAQLLGDGHRSGDRRLSGFIRGSALPSVGNDRVRRSDFRESQWGQALGCPWLSHGSAGTHNFLGDGQSPKWGQAPKLGQTKVWLLGYAPRMLAGVNRCGLGGVCLLNKFVPRPLPRVGSLSNLKTPAPTG